MRLNEIAYVKYGKVKPTETGNVPVVGLGGIYDYVRTLLVNFPTIVIGRKGTAGMDDGCSMLALRHSILSRMERHLMH